jgi:hypothetical protein
MQLLYLRSIPVAALSIRRYTPHLAALQPAERPLKLFREIAARNCLTKQIESLIGIFLQFHERLHVFVLLLRATPCGYFRPPTKDLGGQAVLEPACN